MRKNSMNGYKFVLKGFVLMTLFVSVFNLGAWTQSDACAGVPSLTVGATCTTTNFSLPGSFTNGGLVLSTCNASNNDDGWYSFSATSSFSQITATATSENLVVAVWTSCGGGTQLGCGSAASGGSVTITVPTTSGTTYYVQLHRQSGNNNSSMTGTICIRAVNPPANDNCATATVLTQSASCSTTSGTVAGATNSGVASCTGTPDDDVWYSFTATNTTAIITRSTTWDSGVEIFASTGAAPGSCIGASFGCQDAETDYTVNGLTVGMNYYVRVYTWSSSFTPATPTFTICVTSPAPPPAGSIFMPSSGSTSACSGTFYDGGGLSNYANSDTRVYTICPSTSGAKLKLVFSAFQTEGSLDVLQIFDGNSVAAPLLGTFSGTSSPGTVQASASNAGGCLTFRFTSDGSVVYPGWVAALSCVVPCQTITTSISSITPAPGAGGIIRICQGQSITASGSGTFSSSSAGATYSWNFGNGATAAGSSTTYTYPAVGSYYLNLVATDPNGCTNTNYNNQVIQVSTTPTITTSATPATLCTNATSALSATVTMTPYTVNCTPPVSGTTFLPDGSGVSYSTSITTNCYNPSAIVTAATDITNICLNMEHSYLGDLSLQIQCPNGQSVSLQSYGSGGGSANLGTPWATSTVDGSSTTITPGTGATYCFSMSGATTLVNGITTGGTFPSGNGPGTYTDSYVPAGTYLPATSFSGLVGCPLNGSWTINVTDNLGSDNGYIFDWDINFSGGIVSVPSFTPTIVSQGWVAAPTLSSTGTTTANVTPTNQGAPCFTYSVTDNFGCTYTQPQCINVNCGTSLPIGLVSFEATALDNNSVRLSWETSSEQNNDYFTVERSASGADGWEAIGILSGAGNSQTPKYYSIMDNLPISGVSYYRLKQTDYNGQERIHEMESVYIDIEGVGDLVIFPNPATDLVTLKGDIVSLSTFRLLNAMGQDIRLNVNSYKQGDGTLVLDISSLRSGVYMVKNGSKVYSLVKQ